MLTTPPYTNKLMLSWPLTIPIHWLKASAFCRCGRERGRDGRKEGRKEGSLLRRRKKRWLGASSGRSCSSYKMCLQSSCGGHLCLLGWAWVAAVDGFRWPGGCSSWYAENAVYRRGMQKRWLNTTPIMILQAAWGFGLDGELIIILSLTKLHNSQQSSVCMFSL